MKTFRFAVKQIVPILFSYISVGIAFGILMNEAGYSVLWSVFAATFIYAGSMQIVMLSLLVAGTPLFMMAVMTFFINARHMFYGLGFIERFRKMGRKSPYMMLTMTDETYSVLCSLVCPEELDEQKVDFTISCSCHLLWICSCTLGASLGALLPFDMAGIEFSATAFFVTVCVNQWRQFGSHIPVAVGLGSAIVFYVALGAEHFLLPALSTSLIVLMAMKERIQRQMGGGMHGN